MKSALVLNGLTAALSAKEGDDPFLVHWVRYLVSQGIDRIFFAGEDHAKAAEVLGDGSRLGFHATYAVSAAEMLRIPAEDPVWLVCRGDVYFPIDFSLLLDFHRKSNAVCTCGLKFLPNSGDLDTVELTPEGQIMRSKAHEGHEGYVNSGVFLLSREALNSQSLETTQAYGQTGTAYGLALPDPWIDLRTAGDGWEKALRSALHRKKKAKAVFLDRDGIINEDTGYVFRREDVTFCRGIFSFCRSALREGYKLIVVTNQSGVARGYFTLQEVNTLHRWMAEQFERNEIKMTDFFVCPYHVKAVEPELRRDSLLRKPKPGMVLMAAEKWNLDLTRSFMVGDKGSDRIQWPYMPSYVIQSRYADSDFDFASLDDLGRALFSA